MQKRNWTIAEAKARLSEILRLASEEGPQLIGSRKAYVVVPEAVWKQYTAQKEPLGQWLLKHMPRGEVLELPNRGDPQRDVPFSSEEK